MASFAENSRDALLSQADNYVRYAFTAQQECFALGMSLLTRQLDTGFRIVGARDLKEAFTAYSDLLNASAADFSSTAARLFDRASDAGRAVVEDTAQGVREVTAAASEAVQKVDEVVEKSEEVVRASARRSRRRVQAAGGDAEEAKAAGDGTPPAPPSTEAER